MAQHHVQPRQHYYIRGHKEYLEPWLLALEIEADQGGGQHFDYGDGESPHHDSVADGKNMQRRQHDDNKRDRRRIHKYPGNEQICLDLVVPQRFRGMQEFFSEFSDKRFPFFFYMFRCFHYYVFLLSLFRLTVLRNRSILSLLYSFLPARVYISDQCNTMTYNYYYLSGNGKI